MTHDVNHDRDLWKRVPLSGAALWKKRLFGSHLDTVLTVLLAALLTWALWFFAKWGLWSATFVGHTQSDCNSEGACWVFIKERFLQFMVGFWSEDLLWRPVAFALITGSCVASLVITHRMVTWLLCAVLIPLSAWLILWGAPLGLTPVETSQWGGFLLTILISIVGIIFSLPVGIALALGRRSSSRIFRYAATTFIELWRGVPLITVLFMASVMFPLLLPRSMDVDKLVRALFGITLFSSAYMAEVVRSGLQMIPKGQEEAATALGLGRWQTRALIILPQALRISVPGIVNTFIGLIKDTSLILIIGMFDLLGMIQAASTHPDWLGSAVEGYVFGGLCFFLLCWALSRWSRSLEINATSRGTP